MPIVLRDCLAGIWGVVTMGIYFDNGVGLVHNQCESNEFSGRGTQSHTLQWDERIGMAIQGLIYIRVNGAYNTT